MIYQAALQALDSKRHPTWSKHNIKIARLPNYVEFNRVLAIVSSQVSENELISSQDKHHPQIIKR